MELYKNMENKRASAMIIAFVIIGLVLIVSVIVLVVVLNDKGFFQKKPKNQLETIPLFVTARTEGTNNDVKANYILEYTNEKNERIILSQGVLDDSWNELKAPRNFIYTLICWSNDHYLVKAHKENTNNELSANKSVFHCDMEKIGNLTVEHSGGIYGVKDIIPVNISSKDNFYKTSLCFSWTSGILDVSLKDQFVICDSGSWKNWSSYDPEKRKFTYLPNGTYLCGEEWEEECLFAEGNKCKKSNEQIPKRFENLADNCVYTGKTIRNETYELLLEVRSFEYKNSFDYIKLLIYDKDRRWDESEQRWLWYSEINGENLGSEDINYTIYYDEDCYSNYCEI